MVYKKIIAIVTAIVMLQYLINFPVSAETISPIPGFKLVSENANLRFYFNDTLCTFSIEDKTTGQLWSSYVDPLKYKGQTANDVVKKGMNCLFVLNYSDLDKDSGQINSALVDSTKTVSSIENGLIIQYSFASVNISLQVHIWLDNEGINVKIPYESIKESGKYFVTSIAMLPLFGAANKNDNGYMFYPDGCGALSYFSSIKDPTLLKYKMDIYGNEQVDIDLIKEDEMNGLEKAMLPVFGMKVDENAFVGIITEGECDASINIDLPGLLFDLNRIYSEFKYRRRYSYVDSQKNTIVVISKDIIKQDHAVKYIPLSGALANYSGMASTYREYLIENNKITKKIKDTDKIPLGLDLFMSIKENRMLFDKYIPMTTFKQTETILSEYEKSGVDSILVNLVGYNKDGYGKVTQHLTMSSALGGSKGLEFLNKYVADKKIKLTLQENYIDATSTSGGFSLRNDVVYKENGIIVTDKWKKEYLLNPFKSLQMLLNNLSNYKSKGVSGIAFEKIGQLAYYDFNKSGYSTRQQTVETWDKILGDSKNELGYTAVEGGNMYVLAKADRLLNIPIKDSGYFITDETIPFYQMVVHGYVPYSSNAGNLFYDAKIQKLKWIEYGAIPYYILTYEKTEELRHTDYNQLFTSRYIDWLDQSAGMYKEFNQKLSGIWSKAMINHEKINDNVLCTTYENGTKVYVNYSDTDYTNGSIMVKSMDYLVVDGRTSN